MRESFNKMISFLQSEDLQESVACSPIAPGRDQLRDCIA
jgi:hypothetical protein